jgi:hypothetical protein
VNGDLEKALSFPQGSLGNGSGAFSPFGDVGGITPVAMNPRGVESDRLSVSATSASSNGDTTGAEAGSDSHGLGRDRSDDQLDGVAVGGNIIGGRGRGRGRGRSSRSGRGEGRGEGRGNSFYTKQYPREGRGRGEGKGDRDRERDTVDGRQENKVYQGKSDVRERDNNNNANKERDSRENRGDGSAPVKNIMSPIGPQSSHGRGGEQLAASVFNLN